MGKKAVTSRDFVSRTKPDPQENLKQTKKASLESTFTSVNVLLMICLFGFIYYDMFLVGLGVVLTILGITSIIGVYFNISPMGISVPFESLMRLLFNGAYNRVFNLFWDSVLLVTGVYLLYINLIG